MESSNADGGTLAPSIRATVFAKLSRLYDRATAGWRFAYSGSERYWRYTFERYLEDEFFRFIMASQAIGYVRLAISPREPVLRDFALPDMDDQSVRALPVAAVARLAIQRGSASLRGWMPNTPAFSSLLTIQARESEITMLKSLEPASSSPSATWLTPRISRKSITCDESSSEAIRREPLCQDLADRLPPSAIGLGRSTTSGTIGEGIDAQALVDGGADVGRADGPVLDVRGLRSRTRRTTVPPRMPAPAKHIRSSTSSDRGPRCR